MNISLARKYFAKKKNNSREQREDKFDSSAVGDLAFLLLIFFIVTSSFLLRQGIFLSLPSDKGGKTKIDKELILKVTPTYSGFNVNGADVNRDKFKTILNKHKTDHKEGVVFIEMPVKLKYDRMIDTLSSVKEVGLTRISIKSIKK